MGIREHTSFFTPPARNSSHICLALLGDNAMIMQPEVKRSNLLTAGRRQAETLWNRSVHTMNFIEPKVRLEDFHQAILVITTNSVDRLKWAKSSFTTS